MSHKNLKRKRSQIDKKSSILTDVDDMDCSPDEQDLIECCCGIYMTPARKCLSCYKYRCEDCLEDDETQCIVCSKAVHKEIPLL